MNLWQKNYFEIYKCLEYKTSIKHNIFEYGCAYVCLYVCVWLCVVCLYVWVWLHVCVLVCWLAPPALRRGSDFDAARGCLPEWPSEARLQSDTILQEWSANDAPVESYTRHQRC